MNQELADVRAVFRKGIRARDEIANIRWIKEKAKELGIKKKKNFCSIDYAKGFDCVAPNKLWTIIREMVIQDHLTCLLRNLYEGQEIELDMEQWTDSNMGKEYVKTVYCHCVI